MMQEEALGKGKTSSGVQIVTDTAIILVTQSKKYFITMCTITQLYENIGATQFINL